MIKKIIKSKDIFKVADDATFNDIYIANELIETLEANRKICVGMAANMIGYNKRIIVFVTKDEKIECMINPTIIKESGEYTVSEGCLSLEGERETKRFNKIKVEYYNLDFKKRLKVYEGYEAEIIQHEIDHTKGIII